MSRIGESPTEFVAEPALHTPLAGVAGVAVVGGGTAGVMAAVGAARAGADVWLIERVGSVGGALTAGMIGHFGNTYRLNAGEEIVAGPPRELLERLVAEGATPYGSTQEALDSGYSIFFRHTHAEAICLRMLLDAGARLRLHTTFCDARPAPGGAYDLFLQSKEGRWALRARQVVDCSGEADVARALGAPVEIGSHRSWGLLFEMGHVDLERYEGFLATLATDCPGWEGWLAGHLGVAVAALREDRYWGEWLDGGRRAWLWRPQIIAAVDAGDLALIRELPGGGQIRYGWDGFWPEPWHGGDAVAANVCMVTGLDPTDGDAITRAEVGARLYAFDFLAFLRKYLPGFERACIRILGGQTMSRGGCEIVGEAGQDTASPPEEAVCLARGGAGARGLPLGMFVPRGVENLLVAGKCAARGYGVRGSVTCMAAGYSCGILAALAAERGVTPLRLDPRERCAALARHGVALQPGPLPEKPWRMFASDLVGVPHFDMDEGARRAVKLS